MDDWGTPEEMEARRHLTGEYLDQAGYQNPNDRMNRGELPKTYKAEMALNNAANQKYLEWVQNTPEGQEFARLQGSPMYAQRIENTPRPTTKLGPIELSPELAKPALGYPFYSGMTITEQGTEILPELPNNNSPALRAPNLYSSLGYTNPEFVEEFYNNNGGVDMKPWEDERYYGMKRTNAEWGDYMRRYYSELPENSINNVKTWQEQNRDFMNRFERQENLELPKTHIEDSRFQPQRLQDAERANRLTDSYRRYMDGQPNGRVGQNGLSYSSDVRDVTNDWNNWKYGDPFEIREGMRYFKHPRDVLENPVDWRTDDNWLDNIKPADASKVQEIRKDFFVQQSPKSNAATDSIVDEYSKGDWRNNPIVDNFEDFSTEEQIGSKAGTLTKKEVDEMVDRYKKQSQNATNKYSKGEMPEEIEPSFEKANYKQNKTDNTQKAFEEPKAQRAGTKPYGNPISKEGMRYQNGSGQRAPYFNASAFGAVAPAAHAVNFAMQHPTQATVATGLGLTGVAATNLIHNGMDAAMAYDAASQMVADAQAKYQDFIANGYGKEAAAYFSGLADLIAQQRVEQGID